MKTKRLMILSMVSLASLLTACGGGSNTNGNVSTNTNASTPNTAATTSPSVAPPANNTNSAKANTNAKKPDTAKGNADDIDGQLKVGKTESVILYVGKETGDYAAYCFANDSDAGKAIMAACKDKQQCKVTGKVDYSASCKVPGLEADLSSAGRITSVKTAKAAK